MHKYYYVFNAYKFTNKEGSTTVCLECNNTKYANRFPKKFFFTLDQLNNIGLGQFYDPDVPGVGLSRLYLKVQTKEEIIGASENESDFTAE